MQSGKLEQMSYLKLGGLDCQDLEQIEWEVFRFCQRFAFCFTVLPFSCLLVCSYSFLLSSFPLAFLCPLHPSCSACLLSSFLTGCHLEQPLLVGVHLLFFRSDISCEIVAVRMTPAAWQHLPPEAVLHCRVSTVKVWGRTGPVERLVCGSLALLAAGGGPFPPVLSLLVFSSFAYPKEVEFNFFI